jgi:phosphatidylinositol 4-kinase B
MPLWCSASDNPAPGADGAPQAHHRVVRIPPGESVVLNSAERAPYVLMLEVLNGDLDFDPTKRSNRDVLKKIVAKEMAKKGSSQSLAAFGGPIPAGSVAPNTSIPREASGALQEYETTEPSQPVLGSVLPPTPSEATHRIETPNSEDEDEEEVDVIEQLYGNESLKAKEFDLSESIVLPAAPKNKEFDRVAWARSSAPATPNTEHVATLGTSPGTSTPLTPANDTHVLSLEEYSERMRTAAVMLAQLNASTQAPVANTGPATTGSNRGWTRQPSQGGGEPTEEAKGPLHPSLGGSQHPSSAPAMRSKLSATDAAAIRERIMKEMLSLEEERMARMKQDQGGKRHLRIGDTRGGPKTMEDESIIRRELNKADPSAVVFSESWASKKVGAIDLFNCLLNRANYFSRAVFVMNHLTGISVG